MKIAVWCSTGKRDKYKDTDAEGLPEFHKKSIKPNFIYMDDQIKQPDETHISIDVLTQKLNPELFPYIDGMGSSHSFDAIVLENCPIQLPKFKSSLEKKHVLLHNCMILLKENGLLFARVPSMIVNHPSILFQKDQDISSSLGTLHYQGPSGNPKYIIYKFEPAMRGGTTVKHLQSICKKHKIPYSGLRKQELIQLLTSLKV